MHLGKFIIGHWSKESPAKNLPGRNISKCDEVLHVFSHTLNEKVVQLTKRTREWTSQRAEGFCCSCSCLIHLFFVGHVLRIIGNDGMTIAILSECRRDFRTFVIFTLSAFVNRHRYQNSCALEPNGMCGCCNSLLVPSYTWRHSLLVFLNPMGCIPSEKL